VKDAVWLEFGGPVATDIIHLIAAVSQEKSMLVASVLLVSQMCPVQQPKSNSPLPSCSSRMQAASSMSG